MRSAIGMRALGPLALLGLGSAVPAQVRPDPAAAAKGQVIYVRYCASCHGATGRGDGTLAPDLRVAPTDLTRLAARNGSRFPLDAVLGSIDGRRSTRGHGSPDMPVWGEVFRRTAGTAAPDVESATWRIGHYLWSIQAK
jgi:mono/diheme cytochrome c family protein